MEPSSSDDDFDAQRSLALIQKEEWRLQVQRDDSTLQIDLEGENSQHIRKMIKNTNVSTKPRSNDCNLVLAYVCLPHQHSCPILTTYD